MRERRSGEYAGSPRSTLAVDVSPNRNTFDPATCCFVFWYRLGGYPVGPIPSPSPAVHRYAWTALHYAAESGNCRIVRKLIDANADVDAQTSGYMRAFSFGISVWAAESRRLPCMGTPKHWAARKGQFETIEEVLLSGAVAIRDCDG
jgi:ankyrin repeat protein